MPAILSQPAARSRRRRYQNAALEPYSSGTKTATPRRRVTSQSIGGSRNGQASQQRDRGQPLAHECQRAAGRPQRLGGALAAIAARGVDDGGRCQRQRGEQGEDRGGGNDHAASGLSQRRRRGKTACLSAVLLRSSAAHAGPAPSLHRYAVIMAGGAGTRFWPHSRRRRPKQFLAIDGRRTLLQATARRLRGLVSPSHLIVVVPRHLAPLVRRQLPGAAAGEPGDRARGAQHGRLSGPGGGADRAARCRGVDGGLPGRPRHRRRGALPPLRDARIRDRRDRGLSGDLRHPADQRRDRLRLHRDGAAVAARHAAGRLGIPLRRETRSRDGATVPGLRSPPLELGDVRVAHPGAARSARAPRAGAGPGDGRARRSAARGGGATRLPAAARRLDQRRVDGAGGAHRGGHCDASTGTTSAAGRQWPPCGVAMRPAMPAAATRC